MRAIIGTALLVLAALPARAGLLVEEFTNPPSFYEGLVVDEDWKPLPGVTIRYGGHTGRLKIPLDPEGKYPPAGWKRWSVETGADGRYRFETNAAVTEVEPRKKGYRLVTGPDIRATGTHEPNAGRLNRRQYLMVRDEKPPRNLVHEPVSHAVELLVDGPPVHLGLLAGAVVADPAQADLTVSLRSRGRGPEGEERRLVFAVDAVDGGVYPCGTELPVAPPWGYEAGVRFEDFTDDLPQGNVFPLYVRSRGGKHHARVWLHLGPEVRKGDTAAGAASLSWRSWLNPDGSRRLEAPPRWVSMYPFREALERWQLNIDPSTGGDDDRNALDWRLHWDGPWWLSVPGARVSRSPAEWEAWIWGDAPAKTTGYYLRRLSAYLEIPTALLERMAKDPEPWRRAAAAGNPSTPAPLLRALATDADATVAAALALNPMTPPDALVALASRGEWQVRTALARNAALPAAAVRPLWDNLSPEAAPGTVRHLILRNPAVGTAALLSLDGLLRDRYLPTAPGAPADLLAELYARRRSDYDVRNTVPSHPNFPADLLRACAADPDPLPRRAAAANPRLPRDLIEVLAADADQYVRRNVARQAAAPPQVLARLAGDKVASVRIAVAGNLATPPETLALLAGDRDAWVLRRVFSHPATPAEAWERIYRQGVPEEPR